jgi:uncharacterized protein (DUF885 family)
MPGVEREPTASLADEFWDAYLEADPLQGTALGEHRYGDRLPDVSEGGRSRSRRRFTAVLETARALRPEDPAGSEAAVTRAALIAAAEGALAYLEADAAAYTVDAGMGPQTTLLTLPTYQPLRTADEARAMLARWRAMGAWMDEHVAALRRGLADGRAPIATSVERAIEQIDEVLAQPVEAWPLASPATVTAPAGMTEAAWQSFCGDLLAAVREGVQPAFASYRAFLAETALPAARDDAHAGIGSIPGGADRYRALVRAHTTTDRTPEELHATGVAEVERIDAELAELGGRVLGTTTLADTLAALRGDPELHFATADEILEVASRSLASANEAIPGWFGRLPRTPCMVVAMPAHEARHSTIAYYREPAVDGGRPGQYYVNTSEPLTRPRYEAEALAFHEAVPGHHLQIAIAQELSGLPAFRRHADMTAFIEGWALYTERLSDEMGLYTADLDRIGMLSFDAWRACRLVVDTGMHAFGWPRSRAIAFMEAHTALGTNNIVNEVDRYLAWPGQALAYKTGQLEIARLRREAESRLGAAFDIRRFHDAVLTHGALPLGVLAESVARDLRLDAG